MPTGTNIKDLFNTSSGATKLLSNVDLIKQEVEFLLSFQKYSLFFGNELGLGAEKFLNLRNREATFNLIRSEIQKLFTKYRRVKIRNISMAFSRTESKITIDLTLSTSSYDMNTFNVSFDLYN
jgi:hypothetical protein